MANRIQTTIKTTISTGVIATASVAITAPTAAAKAPSARTISEIRISLKPAFLALPECFIRP
jgi:hypothetical protein